MLRMIVLDVHCVYRFVQLLIVSGIINETRENNSCEYGNNDNNFSFPHSMVPKTIPHVIKRGTKSSQPAMAVHALSPSQ